MIIKNLPVWSAQAKKDLPNHQLSTRYDVILVGTGLAVVSTAYWLAARNRNLSILVLGDMSESNCYPNYDIGTLEFAGSIYHQRDITANPGVDHLYSMSEAGIILLDKFFDVSHVTSCNFHIRGGLHLASQEAEHANLIRFHEYLKKRGVDSILLDQEQITSIVCSNKFQGGLFLPGESTVNPQFLGEFFVQKCVDLGVQFYNGEIDRLATKSVILKNMLEISFQDIVFTSPSTIAYLFPDINKYLKIYRNHYFATTITDEHIPQLFLDYPIIYNNGFDRLRLQDGRIIGTGQRNTVKDMGTGKALLNTKVKNAIIKESIRTFPVLAMTDIEYWWATINNETQDGLPIIDKFADGYYMLSGFGDHELAYTFVAGRVIADTILNNGKFKTYKFETKPYSLSRFQ